MRVDESRGVWCATRKPPTHEERRPERTGEEGGRGTDQTRRERDEEGTRESEKREWHIKHCSLKQVNEIELLRKQRN